MIEHVLWRLALFAAVCAAIAGCRNPTIEESFDPDAGDFDGGDWFDTDAGDDAGAGSLCPEGTPDLFNNSYSPYIGGEESPDLVLVEFAHFHCPWCATFKDIEHDLWEKREDYRARVRLYYHHFPFSYQEIWDLQALSVAAQMQGQEYFWAFHDWYYDKMNDDERPSIDESLSYLENQLQLEMTQVEEVMASDQTMSFLQWDKDQGLAQGVSGTPSVFLCGEKIPNTNNGLWGDGTFEDIIDSYLYGTGNK
ncbi:MAG: thioredoxin domain-containing protein [Polyangia bacterium]